MHSVLRIDKLFIGLMLIKHLMNAKSFARLSDYYFVEKRVAHAIPFISLVKTQLSVTKLD
jgi:hypothetical protein